MTFDPTLAAAIQRQKDAGHPGISSAVGGVVYPQAPQVPCDLCEWPTFVPDHCITQGQIIGLITCSACVEDALAARQLEEFQ